MVGRSRSDLYHVASLDRKSGRRKAARLWDEILPMMMDGHSRLTGSRSSGDALAKHEREP